MAITPPRGFIAGLSVGVGMCEACRVPGAYFYPPVITGLEDLLWLRGIWLCDSCTDPRIVRRRMRHEREVFRSRL